MTTKKKALTCNVCGGPREVKYIEQDESTGRLVERTHMVGCLGHEHLHPSLWNMSASKYSEASQQFMRSITFDDYKKRAVRQNPRKEEENASKSPGV